MERHGDGGKLVAAVALRAVLVAIAALVVACAAAPPSPPPASRDAVAARAATSAPSDSPEARAMRERLVARVARSRGIRDERVLDAMRSVPRHLFIPDVPVEQAYRDRIFRIGYGQTISQPSIVAIMSQALEVRATDRVLEIGTGSGYQAAVLSRLAREVFTIEIVAPLGEAATERLRALGFDNVHVRIGDGYAGWPEHAPFDRVILTAAPKEIPRALVDQLAEGGVLVAPVGEGKEQRLARLKKTGESVVREDLGPVRFVPMVPGDDAEP